MGQFLAGTNMLEPKLRIKGQIRQRKTGTGAGYCRSDYGPVSQSIKRPRRVRRRRGQQSGQETLACNERWSRNKKGP